MLAIQWPGAGGSRSKSKDDYVEIIAMLALPATYVIRVCFLVRKPDTNVERSGVSAS